MYCSKCGNEVEEGTSFCPKCGEKLNKENYSEKKDSTETEAITSFILGLSIFRLLFLKKTVIFKL